MNRSGMSAGTGLSVQKFAKRNRGLLTTAVLLVTMLLVATGVSVSYAIQAKQVQKSLEPERMPMSRETLRWQRRNSATSG